MDVSNLLGHQFAQYDGSGSGFGRTVLPYSNFASIEGSERFTRVTAFMDAMDMGNDNQRYSILDTNSYPGMYSIFFSKGQGHSSFNELYDLVYSSHSSPTLKSWGETVQILTVNTTPSSVPVPGVVWLFGTTMAGLVIRRKSVI